MSDKGDHLMAARFEELDWQQTPQGPISLRRRVDPLLKAQVYEVKLGDEFLMSSMFTHGEIELARLALARLPAGEPLDVVVGGLGLGYTTRTVLADPRVREVLTVETHEHVIGWHRRRLIPDTGEVVGDSRSRIVHGDFFALADGAGFDPRHAGRRFHAVIADIDHSPRHLLHQAHAGFYTPDGLRRLTAHLHPRAVFALWSNDPPDDGFQHVLGSVFAACEAHVVSFDNPLQQRKATNTVYVATT